MDKNMINAAAETLLGFLDTLQSEVGNYDKELDKWYEKGLNDVRSKRISTDEFDKLYFDKFKQYSAGITGGDIAELTYHLNKLKYRIECFCESRDKFHNEQLKAS